MAPVAYATGRGWLTPGAMESAYAPVVRLMTVIGEAGGSRMFKRAAPAGRSLMPTGEPGWLLRAAARGVDAFADCLSECYAGGERHAASD